MTRSRVADRLERRDPVSEVRLLQITPHLIKCGIAIFLSERLDGRLGIRRENSNLLLYSTHPYIHVQLLNESYLQQDRLKPGSHVGPVSRSKDKDTNERKYVSYEDMTRNNTIGLESSNRRLCQFRKEPNKSKLKTNQGPTPSPLTSRLLLQATRSPSRLINQQSIQLDNQGNEPPFHHE